MADVFLGKTPKKTQYRSEGNYKVIKFRDLSSGVVHFSNSKDGFVAKDKDVLSTLREVKKYDVLITSAAHSGENIGKKTAFVEELPKAYKKTFFTGELLNIRASFDGYLSKWLYFYFMSQEGFKQIQKAVYGVHLTSGRAQNMRVVLAPSQQLANTVTKLEKLMAKVDQCKARLEKIPVTLKRFRQSVLAAACSGELTRNFRTHLINFESGSQLINKIKSKRESADMPDYFLSRWNGNELPNSWDWAFLYEVADCRLGKMLDKEKNIGNPTKYLRNINVRWFSFDLSELFEMRATDKDLKKLCLKTGDVLVCEGGEPGRAAVWDSNTKGLIYQKALHRIRLKGEVSPSWLTYNLRNDSDSNRLVTLFTGTTIKHLTGKAIAKYPLAVPPIEEQQEIVRRVESLFKIADQIESRYKKAKAHVDKLTQSILAKAFRGELVPQDPNDEPALKLLERIREGREKRRSEGKPKRRHKKRTGSQKGKTTKFLK